MEVKKIQILIIFPNLYILNRWLFIVESLPTIVLGLLSFFVLPDIPETAGKWLTAEEKQVAIQRTQKSGNTDEKSFDKKQFFAALADYKVWFSGTEIFSLLLYFTHIV